MNLKSIWTALEESQDILGDYAYPAMDKAAEELGLPPIISFGRWQFGFSVQSCLLPHNSCESSHMGFRRCMKTVLPLRFDKDI